MVGQVSIIQDSYNHIQFLVQNNKFLFLSIFLNSKSPLIYVLSRLGYLIFPFLCSLIINFEFIWRICILFLRPYYFFIRNFETETLIVSLFSSLISEKYKIRIWGTFVNLYYFKHVLSFLTTLLLWWADKGQREGKSGDIFGLIRVLCNMNKILKF